MEKEKQSIGDVTFWRTRCNGRVHYSPSTAGWWLLYDKTKQKLKGEQQ
jgi:hypothetical protein